MSDARSWQVVATDIKSGQRRVLSGCKSAAEAEAIVAMAVMRRGVNKEFFTVEQEIGDAE